MNQISIQFSNTIPKKRKEKKRKKEKHKQTNKHFLYMRYKQLHDSTIAEEHSFNCKSAWVSERPIPLMTQISIQ